MAGCRPLTLAEVEHVSRTFAGDFQWQRKKALFIGGVKTGFHISELLSFMVSDVYQRGQVVDEVAMAREHPHHTRRGETSSFG